MDKAETKQQWVKDALARFERPLVSYAHRITGDLDAARDVVQDVFFRLLEANRGEVQDHLAPWLFRVCRNRALDLQRKERPMRSTTADKAAASSIAGAPSGGPSPAAVAERRQSVGRALDLMQQLPQRQQEVVRLKFQQGLSYAEISEVTGHSVSYVGNLLHHALAGLRQLMSEQPEQPQAARSVQ